MSTLHIPGFDLLEPLRESSTAVTWKAVQHSLARTVSIKVLDESFVSDPSNLENFLSVSRAVSRLKHPNLVQIYDVVSRPPLVYLVMECVEGPSTADLLVRNGPLPQAQLVTIAQSVAAAMETAWTQAGLVLRNIKPSEIRLDVDGTPKVADVGLALVVGEHGTAGSVESYIVGTPNYLSPEQAQGSGRLDFRSDMYSLGATLYNLSTGQTPFGNMQPAEVLRAQIESQLPHPRQFNQQLTPGFCQMLSRLMMKLPVDRYASWEALSRELARIAARRPPGGPRKPFQGISTIGPAIAAHSGRTRLRRRGVVRDTGPGGGMRLLLWLLLGAWLAWFARQRWLSSPLEYTVRGGPPVATPPADHERNPATLAAAPVARPSAAAGSEDNTASPVADNGSLPSDFVAELAPLLRDGDLTRARRAAASWASNPATAVARSALEALPSPSELVTEGILRHRGETITIEFMGRQRSVIPVRAINDEITAEFVDGALRREVSFRASQLSTAEQLKWLPEPRSEKERAVRCLLLLSSGANTEVLALAQDCGALEPLLLAASEN